MHSACEKVCYVIKRIDSIAMEEKQQVQKSDKGLSDNIIFQPRSSKKISPVEFCAFQHGLFCGRYLFFCCLFYFRVQEPLADDFGSALFPMQLSLSFFLQICSLFFDDKIKNGLRIGSSPSNALSSAEQRFGGWLPNVISFHKCPYWSLQTGRDYESVPIGCSFKVSFLFLVYSYKFSLH